MGASRTSATSNLSARWVAEVLEATISKRRYDGTIRWALRGPQRHLSVSDMMGRKKSNLNVEIIFQAPFFCIQRSRSIFSQSLAYWRYCPEMQMAADNLRYPSSVPDCHSAL